MHYFGAMTDWKKLNSFSLSLLAGICLIAAWTWSPLVVLLFPAWVMLLELAGRKKRPLLFLYLAFAIWNGGTTYWIANAHPLGVIATVGINAWLMAFALWFGIRARAMFIRLGQRSLITWLPVVASWMAFEHLHEYWGLAFPWLHLGNTFYAWPELVQWYSLIGNAGGTLWVLVVAIIWFSTTKNFTKAAVLLAPVVLSLVMFFMPETSSSTSLAVAVVQPNINSYTEKWSTPERTQIQKVDRLLKESGASDVDLLVLPETFLPKARQELVLEKSVNDAMFKQVLKNYGKSAIFGATTYDFQEEKTYFNRPMGDRYYTLYNTALFQSSTTKPWDIYHKGKLVVGGESMPFVKYLQPILGDWALELGGTSGTLGTSSERTVFVDTALGLKLAPIICWENEFSGYATEYSRAGANLLAVITNDGWWGDTDGHLQHMRFSGLRAIEQRKYVVRSANTGISTILDTKGRPLDRLNWEEEGVILGQVPLMDGETLYVKTGNWLGPLMSILFGCTLLIVLISRFFRIKP